MSNGQEDKAQQVPVRSSEDIVLARQLVRQIAAELGFSIVDQTKLVTAASELARNIVDHAGAGGKMTAQTVIAGTRKGLRLVFEDEGPGIGDIAQAMRDGFSTGSGLGLGLGGAKRLVNEFSIESEPGKGTRITVARWK